MSLMSNFPHEEEPDGDRWLPHHGLYGLIAMAIAVPVGLVGWFLWAPSHDPTLGSNLVLAATGLGLGGALLLADDLISHKWGIPTPGDKAFKILMRWGPFRRFWFKVLLFFKGE